LTDGTTAGTHEIAVNGAGSGGVALRDLTVFDGQALFSGDDAANNVGLWSTDGTTAGTHEITVNGAYSTGVHPYDLTAFNGEVLFGGVDAAGLNALFAYNGHSVSEMNINGAYFGGISPFAPIFFGLSAACACTRP
jgi:ELWxxDGT repeat protein